MLSLLAGAGAGLGFRSLGMGKLIDRSEASRAMAKAIAYKQCGKDAEAAQWARKLVEILEASEILK